MSDQLNIKETGQHCLNQLEISKQAMLEPGEKELENVAGGGPFSPVMLLAGAATYGGLKLTGQWKIPPPQPDTSKPARKASVGPVSAGL